MCAVHCAPVLARGSGKSATWLGASVPGRGEALRAVAGAGVWTSPCHWCHSRHSSGVKGLYSSSMYW
eukprot:12669136-Heterocapsa_arctica.AAC.1